MEIDVLESSAFLGSLGTLKLMVEVHQILYVQTNVIFWLKNKRPT